MFFPPQILSPDELQDGESYVCAGPGESLRRVEYGQRDPLAPPWRSGGGRRQRNFPMGSPLSDNHVMVDTLQAGK